MRLFFALEIDEESRRSLQTAIKLLRGQVGRGSWTRPENLHVTVQFLGEQPVERLDVLNDILQQTATSVGPFPLVFDGCGTFAPRRDILWIGIRPSQPLQALARQIRRALAQAGLPGENRPYQPHLTIARQVQLPGGPSPAWPGPPISCPIRQLSLMESTRRDGVLIYRAILRTDLAGHQQNDKA